MSFSVLGGETEGYGQASVHSASQDCSQELKLDSLQLSCTSRELCMNPQDKCSTLQALPVFAQDNDPLGLLSSQQPQASLTREPRLGTQQGLEAIFQDDLGVSQNSSIESLHLQEPATVSESSSERSAPIDDVSATLPTNPIDLQVEPVNIQRYRLPYSMRNRRRSLRNFASQQQVVPNSARLGK